MAGGTAPPFRAKWLLGLAILTPQRYKIRSPLPEIYGKSDLENVKTADFASLEVAKINSNIGAVGGKLLSDKYFLRQKSRLHDKETHRIVANF